MHDEFSSAARTAGAKIVSPSQYDLMVTLCQLLRPVIHGDDAELAVVSDWRQLLKLADQHLVIPALAWALAERQEVPADVRDFLDGVAYLAAERAATALDELALVVGLLNQAGVVPMLLKGAAAYADDLYPQPGMRLMVDFDLLVPQAQVALASRALSSAGFVPVANASSWFAGETHDLPMQIHPDWPLGIELHRLVLAPMWKDVVDVDACFAAAQPRLFRGRRVLLPHPTDRLAHHIAHSQLQNDEIGTGIPDIRLLLELALLADRLGCCIDWVELQQRFDNISRCEALFRILTMSEALLGSPRAKSPLPAAPVLERLRMVLDQRPRLVRARAKALVAIYWRDLRSNPLRALNLLQLRRWPGRLRHLRLIIFSGRWF